MTYRVWNGSGWNDVPVPAMDGEPLIVPNVAALVRSESGESILLQRRDKPNEPVRGKLEIPGGRWGAGESPEVAVAREVLEETGVSIVAPPELDRIEMAKYRACAVAQGVTAVVGLEGCYPSLHVMFECVGRGQPRPQPGETADPRWWPISEVRELLERQPDSFVDQTRAMLTTYFGISVATI